MRTQGLGLAGIIVVATSLSCTSLTDVAGDYVLVSESGNATCAGVDDDNECTIDACVAGKVVHTFVEQKTPCALEAGIGACNASGQCIPPTCMDGEKNSDEMETDCQGHCSGMGTCVTDQPCSSAQDCADKVCEDGLCAQPKCNDGQKNGDETGTDCGGPCAASCGATEGCKDDMDCAGGECSEAMICVPNCKDGEKNNDESDVDCGGKTCLPCGGEQICNTKDDCAKQFCQDGYCCDQICNGPCMACAEAKTGVKNGVCAPISVGTDPDNECNQDDPSTCGNSTGFCNGSGGCELFPSGTLCGAPASCSGGVATSSAVCDGLGGSCILGAITTCSPYACDGTACGSSCTSDAQCAGTGYCSNAQCLSKKNDGATCTASNECMNGTCVDGVCCNSACGGGDANDCQACNLPGFVGACTTITAGTVCRASAGSCDVAETCNGSATSCPADGFVSAGATCRAASGVCDSAEACTGSSAQCPSDLVKPSGTTCRPVAGICDLAETCNGSSKICPGDGFVPPGTTCRAAVDTCDAPESCTGSSAMCPQNQFAKAGTICGAESCSTPTQRNHQDVCDGAGVCFNGGTMNCPSGCSGTTCTGANASLPVSGIWHNPARPGWLAHVSRNNNNEILLMWMTYRTDGSPIWYYAHMSQQNGKFKIIPGQSLFSAIWENNAATLIPRGLMTFTPASTTSGVISWILDGVAWQEPIQFLVFDTSGTAPNLTGNWYNQNQLGWGVYPSTQHDSMISAFLGYEANGAPTWVYQSAGGNWLNSAFSATLAKRTGVNLCPGCTGPTSFSSVDVGTITLSNFGNNLPFSGRLDMSFNPGSGLAQWDRTNLAVVRNTY